LAIAGGGADGVEGCRQRKKRRLEKEVELGKNNRKNPKGKKNRQHEWSESETTNRWEPCKDLLFTPVPLKGREAEWQFPKGKLRSLDLAQKKNWRHANFSMGGGEENMGTKEKKGGGGEATPGLKKNGRQEGGTGGWGFFQ